MNFRFGARVVKHRSQAQEAALYRADSRLDLPESRPLLAAPEEVAEDEFIHPIDAVWDMTF
jgi:hypothetical protein